MRDGIDLEKLEVAPSPPLEGDAQAFPDGAAGAVAADNPGARRPLVAPVGAPEHRLNPIGIGPDLDRLHASLDLRPEFPEPFGQEPLGRVLLDQERVWIAAVEGAEGHAAECPAAAVEIERLQLVRRGANPLAGPEIVQRLRAARPDHGGAGLALRLTLAVDDADLEAVEDEPDREREADRAGPDHQDIRPPPALSVSCHA